MSSTRSGAVVATPPAVAEQEFTVAVRRLTSHGAVRRADIDYGGGRDRTVCRAALPVPARRSSW
jgi:hypothetical protein